jgi:hypothetical protein
MAKELDMRVVEIKSIMKDNENKGVYVTGLDQYGNMQATVHDYRDGRVIFETCVPSERLEKIYHVDKMAGKLVSIIGENVNGDTFQVVHKSNGEIIFENLY